MLNITFPATTCAGVPTLHMNPSCAVTDTSLLSHIPSQQECDKWLKMLSSGKCHGISCSLGTFNKSSVQSLMQIHILKDTAYRVQREQKWLKSKVTPPNENCQPPSDALLHLFAHKLFENYDDRVVLDKTILASDLGTLTGDNWLTLSIIQGFVKILNEQHAHTKVFVLNNLMGISTNQLRGIVQKLGKGVKNLSFIVNVGLHRNGTFVATPSKPGCHWTMLYVDLTKNTWHYCDTLGWAQPDNLGSFINPIINVFMDELPLPRKPIQGRFVAHEPGGRRTGGHSCTDSCYRNIPVQTCGSICGVAAIVMAAISCNTPGFWSDCFLSKSRRLPDSATWLCTQQSMLHTLAIRKKWLI